MKKVLVLLLATAMLFIGTVAFASNGVNGEEAVQAAFGKGYGRGDNAAESKQASSVDRNIPRGYAAFFLQLDGLQMDTSGNISGRPSALFTDIIATAELSNKNRKYSYTVVIGNGVTESDVLAEVKNPPSDDTAFDAARGQLMHKGYIRSDKGEVIPWAKLNSKNYGIDWYVFKHESDGWHIDGRIIDLSTNDIIDIVIPDDPKDIPDDAYKDDDQKDDKDTGKEDDTPAADTSYNLDGATFAYIFGYEPVINRVLDEDGNLISADAEVFMGMDDNVTVEQVSAMLIRLLDQENFTKGQKYKVTPSVEPYRRAWFARGLAYQCSVGGLDSDVSIPLGDVSRGLVAKLVSHALNLNLTDDVPFADVEGNEYEEDIKKVYTYGYMKGVSKDSFAPDDIMTRAEFCQLFNNIIGRDKMGLTALDKDGNKYEITAADYSFVDMSPSHWAYETCLEATSAYDDNGYVSITKRQENIRNKLDDYDSQLLY